MKRSELNQILENRILFSSQYDCISIEEESEGESKESYFSHSGCESCSQGLAGDVFPCIGLSIEDTEKKIFDNIYNFEICGDCLNSLFNGEDSDLDYYCTEEDTTDLREDLRNLRIIKSHYHYLDNEEEELTLDSNENEEKYFFYFGLPGCLPDSEFFGPYDSLEDTYKAVFELFV